MNKNNKIEQFMKENFVKTKGLMYFLKVHPYNFRYMFDQPSLPNHIENESLKWLEELGNRILDFVADYKKGDVKGIGGTTGWDGKGDIEDEIEKAWFRKKRRG